MSRAPLSLVVITLNAGPRLEACLRSADFADELLVVDSGSRDGTPELAARLGARVLHQDWLGFGPQKQFAVGRARHDWVLCLDADERLSPALAMAVRAALDHPAFTAPDHPAFSAYRMARSNRFLGRYLRHGEGYPDWSLRLFDRRRARWSDDPVHEKVLSDGPVGTLTGDLLHDSAEDLDAYLAKQNRYTTLQAQALFAAGERAGGGRVVLSPLVRFFKFYVARGGFRDGLPGLAHVLIGCANSFYKYLKLYALWRGRS